MSIENPTLAHFRHFSSLFTPLPLYICRELSTKQPFLCKTNPILSAAGGLQMNVSIYSTKAYKNETAFRRVKNKPNSNPNKPNLKRAKMNVNSFITKDYRKKDDFLVRINKPNFVKGPK
jgi:hypothetical protein